MGQLATTAFAPPGVHYPEVDRPVIAMGKEFAPGARTGPHRHERAQLIFAIEGLMVATTACGTWAVPRGHALFVPTGVAHDVAMHGAVAMRTAYLLTDAVPGLPGDCRVILVSELLAAALVALSAEPPAYDPDGRGGHLAALILNEIGRAQATPFALPVPADRRLEKLARRLLEAPRLALDLDAWASEIGTSRRTLTRLFRAQTGLSFAAWRRRLRLLHAAAAYADGEPLARVAASVGYRSVAAFRAMARKELGAAFEGFGS